METLFAWGRLTLMTADERLLDDAAAWAARKKREFDPDLARTIIDLRRAYDGHEAGFWPVGAAESLVLVRWPAHGPVEVPAPETLTATLDTLWRFLRGTGRMSGASATPADLLRELRRALPQMEQRCVDRANWSQGRVLQDFGESLGLDLAGAGSQAELATTMERIVAEWNDLPDEERSRLMPDPSPKTVEGIAFTERLHGAGGEPWDLDEDEEDQDEADLDAATSELVRQLLQSGMSAADLIRSLTGGKGFGDSPFATPLPTPTLFDHRPEPATYRLRVDLNDVKPPIWRRLDVPSDLTLDQFHVVLQAAMGWFDVHMHGFRMRADGAWAYFVSDEHEDDGVHEGGLHEADVRLDQVLASPGDRITYDYDYGDGWEHTVRLEKVLPLGEGGCVGGRRACPPENCGGVPGYESLVESMGHGEGGDLVDEDALDDLDDLDGLGDLDDLDGPMLMPDWDPEEFEVEEADRDVKAVLSGGWAGIPDLGTLDETLVGMLVAARGTAAERMLATITSAALDADPEEDPYRDLDAEIPEWMRPLQVLLDVVGDGVDLTSAGYLRPDDVSGIFTRLDMQKRWIGKGNREDLTPPVANLRRLGRLLGLVQARKGRLLPTKAGRSLREDSRALWSWIAGRLPAGRAGTKEPAILYLLAAASGGIPPEFSEVTAAVLGGIGWSGGTFTGKQASSAIDPTYEILYFLGGVDRQGRITDLGQALAAKALRSRQ